MRIILFAIGILLIYLILKINFNNAAEFKLTNVVCESYNKSWMIINTCRLRAISRNRTIFNFNGTILHPAHDILVKGQLFRKVNGYKPWLYKVTIDACQFVKKSYNPIAILVYKQFRDFSNINHTCPYMGPQIISGFYFRTNLLRGLSLPTDEYLVAIDWVFDKKTQFVTNYYFRFVKDL